ncbi:MAG: hypothetical protein ACMXYM_00340 [Candidatus Woesearchaeota archaeon]
MRGQAVAEYAILIAAALLIAATFIAIASTYAERTSQARHQTSVNDELERLQSELVAAAIARDGYERTIVIKPRNAVSMTIRVHDNWIEAESSLYSNIIRIPDVNGTVELDSGSFTVRKHEGSVIVS